MYVIPSQPTVLTSFAPGLSHGNFSFLHQFRLYLYDVNVTLMYHTFPSCFIQIKSANYWKYQVRHYLGRDIINLKHSVFQSKVVFELLTKSVLV